MSETTPAMQSTAPVRQAPKLSPEEQAKSDKARSAEAKAAADAAKDTASRQASAKNLDALTATYSKAAKAVTDAFNQGMETGDVMAYRKLRETKRLAAEAMHVAEQERARQSHKK